MGVQKLRAIFVRSFLLIAEPRVIRVIWFFVYAFMLAAGVSVLVQPPDSVQDTFGVILVYSFGCFLTGGGLFAALSVLPGIWWVERVGIIAIETALGMFVVVTVSTGGPLFSVFLLVAFIVTFVRRWIGIRQYQLAPRIG